MSVVEITDSSLEAGIRPVLLTYATYLKANDDVLLPSSSASFLNEFCEVVLGGSIVVPAAIAIELNPHGHPATASDLMEEKS